MKISAKSRYGLRAMACLAEMGKLSPSGLVAEKEGISPEYLEKIFARLKRAGLLDTVRGAQGGYALARPAEKITAGEVIRVLEGDISPSLCVSRGREKEFSCPRKDKCHAKDVWEKVRLAMVSTLDSITLKDLIK